MRNGRDPESPEKKVKTSRRVCIHVGLGGNTREKSFSLPLSVSAAERGAPLVQKHRDPSGYFVKCIVLIDFVH